MNVRIGLCGFSMAFDEFVREFPLVEVQQTFYEPPRDSTMRRWRALAPDGFEFTVKAWQLVTHEAGSPTYRRLRRALSDEERGDRGPDGDAAFALELERVGLGGAGVDAADVVDRARGIEQSLAEGGLTGVDVREDA